MLKLTMKTTEIDDSIDNTDIPNTTTEHRSTKNKRAPKAPIDETEISIKSSENKRKAPKIPITTNTDEYEYTDETRALDILEKEDSFQESSIFDQEVPVKSKKKRAPKIEIPNENDEFIPIEETITKKKSKAPKPPPINDDDDDNYSQNIETSSMDLLESSIDIKPKKKKSKRSKLSTETFSASSDELKITNLDEIYPQDQEIDVNTNDTIPIDDIENVQSSENNTSEYETIIIDAYSNLASNVNFSQYFGDEWRIAYLPKAARTDEKSRIRKMLPGGGNKDEKLPKKTMAPKGGLLTRLRHSVNTLVRDENNIIFGERSNLELRDYGDDPDEIDTDNLNRYAQKLRDLEDRDREINPEFLVLRDGKTLYAVHESDADGTVKLAKRKPIFDRLADQKINEQSGKKTLLSRLKSSFNRSKDTDENDSQSLKLDGDTSNTRSKQKLNKKSSVDDINMVAYDDLGMN